ncbi:hypothetical protein ACJJTC_006445 [Scirpophaga incertulas]
MGAETADRRPHEAARGMCDQSLRPTSGSQANIKWALPIERHTNRLRRPPAAPAGSNGLNAQNFVTKKLFQSWKILTDHLGLYTIKKLSDTRWEARISSVKAVRYQISAIHDALITLAIETQKTDVQVSHEATTLVEQLRDFSFIVSLVVWYDILFQINIVSKSLQSTDMDLGKCTEMLKKCCHFMEDYRNTGFKSAILTAKELAAELQIEPVFQARRRIRHVKRQVGEIARDDPITSLEKKIRD